MLCFLNAPLKVLDGDVAGVGAAIREHIRHPVCKQHMTVLTDEMRLP